MSKSYGNSIPSFFLYNDVLSDVQNAILTQYPQVSICYETININATVNPKNYLCRECHKELSNIRDLQGVYVVYLTEKENSNLDAEDILFAGSTSSLNENSPTYFYEYDHEGYIPKLLDMCKPFNPFYKFYKEKGYSHSMRLDEFMNKYSILCVIIDSDFDKDIISASAELFCCLTTELVFYSGHPIKTIETL